MLHDRGDDAVSAIEAARVRFGRRVDLVAPQAARPCNPFQSNLRGAHGYEGWSWYLGDDADQPEAASFGDVLAELELFVTGLGRPFVLTGRGQGAVLALTLALHALPGLVGVWSDGGGLARIEGWRAPDCSLGGLPLVLEGLDELRLSCAREAVEARGSRILATSPSPPQWLEALAAEPLAS